MINNLWRCFETTGDIHTYLGFKDYEKTRHQQLNIESMNQSEPCDGISGVNET